MLWKDGEEYGDKLERPNSDTCMAWRGEAWRLEKSTSEYLQYKEKPLESLLSPNSAHKVSLPYLGQWLSPGVEVQ